MNKSSLSLVQKQVLAAEQPFICFPASHVIKSIKSLHVHDPVATLIRWSYN